MSRVAQEVNGVTKITVVAGHKLNQPTFKARMDSINIVSGSSYISKVSQNFCVHSTVC